MTRLAAALLAATLLLLSGCASSPTPSSAVEAEVLEGAGDEPQAESDTQPDDATTADAGDTGDADGPMRLRGHVLSASLHPIGNATVRVVGFGQPRVTGPDGAFDFGSVERRIYALTATAPGHEDASVTVAPGHQGDIRLVLQAGDPVVPYQETVHFRGVLECAFEALIISPSCDSALVAAGGPALFETNHTYLFSAQRGWKTLVIDVVFDGEAHPGLDGLRIAVRGSRDPDGGGEYTQYGRWHGPESFTARLEPGGSYADGTEAVPGSAAGFQVDVYPHSHAYHPAEAGFLGVGFAQNVRFDLYATLFYVEPAPEGWTFRDASA
jgi:hypothetical protein